MKKIKKIAIAAIFCAATFAGYTAYDKATITNTERILAANIIAVPLKSKNVL